MSDALTGGGMNLLNSLSELALLPFQMTGKTHAYTNHVFDFPLWLCAFVVKKSCSSYLF